MGRVTGLAWALAVASTSASAGTISYRSEARIDLADVADDFQVAVGYRYYYLSAVDNDMRPVFLQPFLQRASFAEIDFADGPASRSLFEVAARYVIPNAPVGVDLAFGTGDYTATTEQSYFLLGGVLWLRDESDLAAEASVAFEEYDNADRTRFQIGARFLPDVAGRPLEIALAFKSVNPDVGPDDSGLVGVVRYFFAKELYAGASFDTVDEVDKFAGTLGYCFDSGVSAEIEIGSEYDEFLLRVTAIFRF